MDDATPEMTFSHGGRENFSCDTKEKERMIIYVHSKCPHSLELTRWMVDNVSESDQMKVKLDYDPPEHVLRVPVVDGTSHLGTNACITHIVKTFGVAEATPVAEETVESNFQRMISERKQGGGSGASNKVQVPTRTMPQL